MCDSTRLRREKACGALYWASTNMGPRLLFDIFVEVQRSFDGTVEKSMKAVEASVEASVEVSMEDSTEASSNVVVLG